MLSPASASRKSAIHVSHALVIHPAKRRASRTRSRWYDVFSRRMSFVVEVMMGRSVVSSFDSALSVSSALDANIAPTARMRKTSSAVCGSSAVAAALNFVTHDRANDSASPGVAAASRAVSVRSSSSTSTGSCSPATAWLEKRAPRPLNVATSKVGAASCSTSRIASFRRADTAVTSLAQARRGTRAPDSRRAVTSGSSERIASASSSMPSSPAPKDGSARHSERARDAATALATRLPASFSAFVSIWAFCSSPYSSSM
mmetsp:Transcript_2807/g.9082  ORF Transcript_2807/g.9082 Transcript_2807/m.9082 type:complete len:259 (-) Transcript_2807:2222-2998(-)